MLWGMGFFDRYLTETPPPVRRKVARPAWSRPEAVLPGVAPLELVLARTDDVAVAIPVLLGYPTGFEFDLALRLRAPGGDDRLSWALHGVHGPGGQSAATEALRLAVVYPDGRTATNVDLRHHRPEAEGGLWLSPGSGGGGGGRYDMTYWVHPLPPPGSVTFICEWPRFGVPETRIDVPAQVILDASARAVSLWPEPEDEVYEPPDIAAGPSPAGPSPAGSATAYASSLNLSFDPEAGPDQLSR